MGKVKILRVIVRGVGCIYNHNRDLDNAKIMDYDEIDLYRYRVAEAYETEMCKVEITYSEDLDGENY